MDSMQDFSLDGSKIVFSSYRSGNLQMWVVDSTGNNPVQITSLTKMGGGVPRWSPNGKEIVFDYKEKGDSDIFVVNADGGPHKRAAAKGGRPAFRRSSVEVLNLPLDLTLDLNLL